MKTILITGGGGFVGTLLVSRLIKKKYNIIIYDTFYYGNYLPKNSKIKIIKGDIRNKKLFKKNCKNVDIVIHLACISNDPSFEIKKGLSKKINYDCFEDLVISAKQQGVKRFIYCSTSSVYGVSKKKKVVESDKLVPLTDYNKYKGLCEPLLFKHTNTNFVGVVCRPATICGYSKRCRLDLTVNIFTNQAYFNKKITIFGGEQKRPNLNILDMCRAYELLIKVPDKKIANKVFNIGFRNLKIKQIAIIVKKEVEKFYKKIHKKNIKIKIIKSTSNDNRSYHIDSTKIKKELNFKPKYSLEDAIKSLCYCFYKKEITKSFESNRYFNVKKLKEIFK
jgi:nucleoside-diphosphate-sugar epimerase